MQPPAKLVPYRCGACGWTGDVLDSELRVRRHTAKSLRKLGEYACSVDERLLCKQCCPAPVAGDTDLRHFAGDGGHRIEVTHARRGVRRVIWVSSCDVQDLESTLLGRRDAAYLGTKTISRSQARAVEPGLQRWWRELRAELDNGAPDMGRTLGFGPRVLDFGKLADEPVARPLHLLNPTRRAAVFELTGAIVTTPVRAEFARSFPYQVGSSEAVEAARRDAHFEVAANSRLVVDVLAQPWARKAEYRRVEVWVTPSGGGRQFLGAVELVHR